MENKRLIESIEWVLNNLEKIPIEEFEDKDLDYFKKEEDTKDIIWLLDREDGTAGNYETSLERLGIKRDKNIIFGFTSGCSCWSGWSKDDYKETTYKEFIIKNIISYNPKENYYSIKSEADLSFSEGWENEIIGRVEELKKAVAK